MRGDEGVVVNVRKEPHDELAVHPVGDAAMAGDGVAEILDAKGALQAGCEEAAKGSDEGSKSGKGEAVEVNGGEGEGEVGVGGEEEELGELVGFDEEDGIEVALETSEDVGSEVLFDQLANDDVDLSLSNGWGPTLTGQMKNLVRIMTLMRMPLKRSVQIQAPTKPSTVFLGDSLMSWVRPKAIPQI